LGLEVVAEEMEVPFGNDCNDLPLQDYVKVIERSITEIVIVDRF
jgi:predicted membrane chloride channel (bestrophin family)